jgi:hypothetical protein
MNKKQNGPQKKGLGKMKDWLEKMKVHVPARFFQFRKNESMIRKNGSNNRTLKNFLSMVDAVFSQPLCFSDQISKAFLCVVTIEISYDQRDTPAFFELGDQIDGKRKHDKNDSFLVSYLKLLK